jgi:hypothetical protein
MRRQILELDEPLVSLGLAARRYQRVASASEIQRHFDGIVERIDALNSARRAFERFGHADWPIDHAVGAVNGLIDALESFVELPTVADLARQAGVITVTRGDALLLAARHRHRLRPKPEKVLQQADHIERLVNNALVTFRRTLSEEARSPRWRMADELPHQSQLASGVDALNALRDNVLRPIGRRIPSDLRSQLVLPRAIEVWPESARRLRRGLHVFAARSSSWIASTRRSTLPALADRLSVNPHSTPSGASPRSSP